MKRVLYEIGKMIDIQQHRIIEDKDEDIYERYDILEVYEKMNNRLFDLLDMVENMLYVLAEQPEVNFNELKTIVKENNNDE